MAGLERTLNLVLKANASDAVHAFKDVAHEAGNTAKETSKHASGISKAFKGAAVAALPVVGAALAIGAAGIEAADTFEGSQARLQGAIKNTGDSFDKFKGPIDGVNKKLEGFGFKNADVEDSLAILTRASGGVAKALPLMGLAADLAKGRNISLADATKILAKVQTGHVAQLGKLGIATKDAAGKTISQQEAIKKLNDLYGGQAKKSAETFAGRQEVLKARMADLQVKIGEKVIPIIEKLADVFVNKIIPAIDTTVGWIQDNLIPIFVNIKDAVDKFIGGMDGFKEKWDEVFSPERGTKLQVIYEIVAHVLSNIRDAVEFTIGVIQATWDRFGNAVIPIIKGVWDIIYSTIAGTLNAIRDVIKIVTALIHGDWGKAWDGLKNLVSDAWNQIIGTVKGFGEILKGVFIGILDGISAIFGGIISGFFDFGKRIIGAIIDGITSLAGDVGGAIKNVINSIPGASIITSHIPGFAEGGIVPGAIGAPRLAVVHGGERVIPVNGTGGGAGSGGVVINISVAGSNARDLVNDIALEIQNGGGRNLQRALGVA